MSPRQNRWSRNIFVLFVLVGSLGVCLNGWIMSQLQEEREAAVVVPKDVSPGSLPLPVFREVSRVTQLDPNRTFFHNIIYADGNRIAAFKTYEGSGYTMFELEGNIPDGKVTFMDRSRNTSGVESYRDNQRHGICREYYESGPVRRDILFEYGKAVQEREYYIDGTLRMDINYRDALAGIQDNEVGIGKVYYRDGTLRYEWSLTNRDRQRYKKSYNIAGDLVQEKIYDARGNLLRTIDH